MDVASVELFSFRRCPYAMRARMALHASGIAFRIHEVSLRDKPQRMLALSPKGTVPVLVVSKDQGQQQVIDESLDIMRWALSQSDPDGWLRFAGSAAGARLLQINDGPFKHWLDRYKYVTRFADEGITSHDARTHACEVMFDPLADILRRQPFIGGSQPALEDVAIFPFVRQFAGVEPQWFGQSMAPQVIAWLDGWLESELFRRVMQKSSGC